MTDTEVLLREALDGGAGALDVPEDPWLGFAKREKTHRRNRRIRIAAVAAAVIAAVGVQTGVVPLPGWAPTIAVAGRQTALTKASTRGNLAGDRDWLAGMRREIKDVVDPDAVWRVVDRDKITFVYAADVRGHRLALALVTLRFGFLSDQALIWYEGPAGAAPAQMIESGREDGGQTVMARVGSSAEREGLAVVLAPPTATVAVSSGFTYTADGRVAHGKPVVSGGGLAEVTLPPAPYAPDTNITVTDGGRTLFSGSGSGGWSSGSGADAQEPTAATIDRALAGHTFDRLTFQRWVEIALHDARLPAAGTTVALRWTGTVNGQPAALFTLRPKDGGVLAYAMHGGPDSSRQDLRLLLPAAGADQRPIAWRMRAEGVDDRTDQLLVVTPPGTHAATLTVAGAAPVPLTLDTAGAAVTKLDPSATATVTADPAGTSTPVPPFETDSGGLPGDTPKTRVVG